MERQPVAGQLQAVRRAFHPGLVVVNPALAEKLIQRSGVLVFFRVDALLDGRRCFGDFPCRFCGKIRLEIPGKVGVDGIFIQTALLVPFDVGVDDPAPLGGDGKRLPGNEVELVQTDSGNYLRDGGDDLPVDGVPVRRLVELERRGHTSESPPSSCGRTAPGTAASKAETTASYLSRVI